PDTESLPLTNTFSAPHSVSARLDAVIGTLSKPGANTLITLSTFFWRLRGGRFYRPTLIIFS
ncbi:MAG TPA: hypothetical protein PLU99_00875, partial [Phycisphaerae bacterium]|nr:hypothetical protein [Phycisphaerae bacterium]